MDRYQGRVAVVTGASSGIGAAIAKDLVEAGLTVVGLARRKERIDELRKSLPRNVQNRLHALRCDVSDSRSVDEAFEWIEKNLSGIDVLVNSAGTHRPGQILKHDITTLQEVLQTNVIGVLQCTQRAVKSMRQRNCDGHVVIVNSVLGHNTFVPQIGTMPQVNVYPATKYALTAINEILRQELQALGTRIKVTSVSPGLVNTELVLDDVQRATKLKTRDVSNGILYALSTPQDVQIHELTIKALGETLL